MEPISGRNGIGRPPPTRGLSLGWRLALSTALIVSLVMGGISVTQQRLEIRQDREARRSFLKLSLTPLAVRLESATTVAVMRRNVEEVHGAFASKGYPVHDLMLLDAAGRQVLSTSDAQVSEERADLIRARVPIASPLFDGGQGTLVVYQHIPEYRDGLRRTWLLWFAHFTVTVGVLSLFLAIAVVSRTISPSRRRTATGVCTLA